MKTLLKLKDFRAIAWNFLFSLPQLLLVLGLLDISLCNCYFSRLSQRVSLEVLDFSAQLRQILTIFGYFSVFFLCGRALHSRFFRLGVMN